MSIKEIYPKNPVVTSFPKNIEDEDNHLFTYANIESNRGSTTKVIEFDNVFIWDTIFFSYFGFRQEIADLYYIWLPPTDYKYVDSFSIKAKIKFLLKKHLFSKTKQINNAYWIEDNWCIGGYFHWIADALTKIIAIKTIDNEAVFILSEKAKKISFIVESLNKLKINTIFLDNNYTYKINKFNLVTPTSHTGTYNIDIINLVADNIKLNIHSLSPSKNRRVYISRKKAARRFIVNEEEVENLLLEYDFECLLFEDFTWEEQVKIAKNTKILVSLHGAGLTNMIAMPEKSKVLEFRMKDDKYNHCYFLMAAALNIDYYYQLCNVESEIDSTQDANFVVDVNKLRLNLEMMINP